MARLTCRRIARPCLAGLLAVVVWSASALAHPIHTTLSILSTDASGQIVTIRIRAFADDFSATVARFSGRPAPADSSAHPDDIARYVRSVLLLSDDRGQPVTLEPCGVDRVRELYWLCLRARIPAGTRHVRIRNLMLTELHADQVNIVQLERSGTRKTLLFTRSSPTAALP